jgi:ABC-type polysaccharide/polyol phosphate export permease
VLTLAIACARFRDLPQAIANVMQLMFFVTPIMWKRELLSADYQWIAEWNPLLLVLDVIRGPLLSIQPSLEEYMFLVGAIIFVSSVGGVVFRRYKKQLPFWA